MQAVGGGIGEGVEGHLAVELAFRP
jgi:hypothetical protein